jgi:hypothetical protein
MSKIEPAIGTAPADAKPFNPSSDLVAEGARWADYVTNLRDGGNVWWFYIRCGNTQDYSVAKNAVTSLKQVGICGNWALYYMVL